MDNSKCILVIENEKKLSQFVSLELENEEYQVITAADGREGLEKALSYNIDLILIDLVLPKLNGFEVIRRIRREKETPIIITTTYDSIMDRVAGLDIGADDYIVKPFSIEELLARIRSIFRRMKNKEINKKTENVSFRDLHLDKTNLVVYRNQKMISLTRREFALLSALINNAGNVVTREYLLSEVWGYEKGTKTNMIGVYIRYLRNKIDRVGTPNYIRTIRGIGYIMNNHL